MQPCLYPIGLVVAMWIGICFGNWIGKDEGLILLPILFTFYALIAASLMGIK